MPVDAEGAASLLQLGIATAAVATYAFETFRVKKRGREQRGVPSEGMGGRTIERIENRRSFGRVRPLHMCGLCPLHICGPLISRF